MKKFLLFTLIALSYLSGKAQITVPVNPQPLSQNSLYYEPSTGRRWGYNGTTRGWYVIPDSTYIKLFVHGGGGADTISFTHQFQNLGTATNARINLSLDTIFNGSSNSFVVMEDSAHKTLRYYPLRNFAVGKTLYTGNGTIITSRIVTQGSNSLIFRAKATIDSAYLQIVYTGVRVGGLLTTDTLQVLKNASVVGNFGVNGNSTFYGGAQVPGGQNMIFDNSHDNALNYYITNGNETAQQSSLLLYNINTNRGLQIKGNNLYDFNGKMFLKDTVSVGGGSVTTVSVVTANGLSGTVANASTTPAITLSLNTIKPATVVQTPIGTVATDSIAVKLGSTGKLGAIATTGIQKTLIAGTNITITGTTISSTGGGSSFTRQVITSGTSATVTGGNYIVTIDPSSTIASYALTLPASPSDLDVVEVDFGGTLTSGTIVTALTISPNSGQTILDNTPPVNATADNTLLYRYRTSNTKWYRFKP